MRIWIKLALGTVLGLLLGLYLPAHGGDTSELLRLLSTLAVNGSRYVLFPLCFFAITVAIYELRQERAILKLGSRLLGLAALTTLGCILLGLLGMAIFSPARVPIVVERQAAVSRVDFGQLLLQVLPDNMPLAFFQNANFLLPLALLALFLGLNLTFDRQVARPILDVFDSLNRVLYHMNALITELLGIGAIALAAATAFQIRSVSELDLFAEIIFVVGVVALVAALVAFPLVLYFAGKKKIKVGPWLLSQLGPAIVALLTGDTYAVLGLLMRQGKEDLGIRRKLGAPLYSFLSVFGRSGTAAVTAMGFIIVLRSYSSLEITIFQTLWIIVASFVASFLLGAYPALGVSISLSLLASLYGRGMDQGYLILLPVAFILNRIAVFLDVLAAAFVATLTAELSGEREQMDPAKAI